MYALTMAGTIGSDPTKVTDASALIQAIDLAFQAVYDSVQGGALSISGTFIPSLGSIAKVRAIAIRAVDGQSLVVKLTSAAGTDQAIPVSDLLLLRAQNVGDEITAVKIVGSGRLEFLIAGNVS